VQGLYLLESVVLSFPCALKSVSTSLIMATLNFDNTIGALFLGNLFAAMYVGSLP
jgi:hypothetical protein